MRGLNQEKRFFFGSVFGASFPDTSDVEADDDLESFDFLSFSFSFPFTFC